MNLLEAFFLIAVMVFIVPSLLAVSAMFLLSPGIRPGLTSLTIDEAVLQLKQTGKTGWELVAAATLLVHARMQYCRRNSWDSYNKAFTRGYGYCQQQTFALKSILEKLGFKAQPVHSFRNRFPDGKIGSHSWVVVNYNNEYKNFCPVFPDSVTGESLSKTLGKIYKYNSLFRVFAQWGAGAVNAIVYYRTRKD